MSKLSNFNKQPFKSLTSLLILFSFLLVTQPAMARWAKVEDLDIAHDIYNQTIEINKDGSYTETSEILLSVLKESGKDSLVSYPIVYNKASTDIKILEAKTLRDGKEYPVDLKNMEDKPLASSPQGFDQNYQILLAFPQMALNAKAYLKVRKVVKPPFPGFFSYDFVYGADTYLKVSKLRVVSELPLFIKTHDQEKILDIKEYKEQQKQVLEITLKKPIIKLPLEEQYACINSKIYPWVTVSSLRDWSALGNVMSPRYEAVINQKLPLLLENIAKEAEKKSTLIEKINTITARLAENISYMGDWRTVKGALVPRNLTEIAKSKMGDCKDFTASTAAILRRIGVNADPAVIYRQAEAVELPNDLPNVANFNHVIVRVKDGDNILWIDPTNFTSYAQGIYPDIAERMALVLDPKNPTLMKTATITARDAQVTLVKKIFLPQDQPNTAIVEGRLSLMGVRALPLVGADLRASKDAINRNIIGVVTDESRTTDWKVGDYNLTSRIAENLNFNFNFTEKNNQVKTSAGEGFMLNAPATVNKFLTKTHDRVTGIFLELPGLYRHEILLAKTQLVGDRVLNCSLESPWLKATRNIQNTAEGIKIIDELEVIKNKISNEELLTTEFSQFQNKVFTCFGDTTLVYKPL